MIDSALAGVNLNAEYIFMTIQIYAGYVDDPRNTDNAWMETVAENFHDEAGTVHVCMTIT